MHRVWLIVPGAEVRVRVVLCWTTTCSDSGLTHFPTALAVAVRRSPPVRAGESPDSVQEPEVTVVVPIDAPFL